MTTFSKLIGEKKREEGVSFTRGNLNIINHSKSIQNISVQRSIGSVYHEGKVEHN